MEQQDLILAEQAISTGFNLSFIDFVLLGFCFIIITMGFIFGKKYFSEKGVLFPASLFIFLSALSLSSSSLLMNDLKGSASLFILYISLIVFSLSSADSKTYLLSKLQTMIFLRFKELSYSEFFVTKEDIKDFLITKSKITTNYNLYINIGIIIIGFSCLFCLFINYKEQSIKTYTNFIVFSYIFYFILTYTIFKLMEKQKLIFELMINDFISNKAYQKLIKDEIEFGPTYYIDKVKNRLILIDGKNYCQAHFSDIVLNLKQEEINQLLDRANGNGRSFHS